MLTSFVLPSVYPLSFQTFLSYKYGYHRPFPPKILAEEFQLIFSGVEEKKDQDLLTKWFVKDENMIPPHYILQPIQKFIPDYRNRKVSKTKQDEAKKKWSDDFEQMQAVFQKVAPKKVSDEIALKYFMSGILTIVSFFLVAHFIIVLYFKDRNMLLLSLELIFPRN